MNRLCIYCVTRRILDGYVTCGYSDCQEAHCKTKTKPTKGTRKSSR